MVLLCLGDAAECMRDLVLGVVCTLVVLDVDVRGYWPPLLAVGTCFTLVS